MSFNIRPKHVGGQAMGTSSTHSTLTQYYNSGNKTYFENPQPMGTNSTHGTLYTSQYQYSYIVSNSESGEELIAAKDEFTKIITKHFEELSPVLEQFFNGKKNQYDSSPVREEFTKIILKHFDENAAILDQFANRNTRDLPSPCGEVFGKRIIKHFSESIACKDDSQHFVQVGGTFTTKIEISAAFEEIYTTHISIDGYINDRFTTNINIIPSTLAPVTNVSSTENPFLPTVIIGGEVLVENPETANTSPDVFNYIRIADAGISNRTYCDMNEAVFKLDCSGGNFSVRSNELLTADTTPQATLLKQIDIFGFTATITDCGANRGPSNFEWETEGIFSTPLMNKQFSIITYANRPFLQFINSSQLFAIPQSNTYTTVKGMAQAIAAAAGITLTWIVPDAPYRDTFNQSGQTALEALSSLAGQVGARLRWNGSTHYVICYPDFTIGLWSIPSEGLITNYSYKHHADLGYGLTGTGAIGLPVNTFFDPSTRDLPDSLGGSVVGDPVERIGSVTKLVTSDDPPITFDLPNDIVSVKIQIITPSKNFTAAKYVTTDPSIWYDLGSASITNPYVKVKNVGGNYRNQLIVSSGLFPANNPNIENGNFTMNFGIVRQSLKPAYDEAKKDAEANLRDLIARIQANIRFLKTFTASVSFVFFGSIPLPGMAISFTRCGENVQGIIESVSINNGTVTVEIAAYLRVNLIDAKLKWDLTNGAGP
jgi:hypothetical protein